MANLNIIDISKYNGTVSWAKAAAKIDGVVIRAGYRGTSGALTTDSIFLQHITGAIAAGVKRIGVYWWTTHTTEAQAKADAAYLVSLLKPYKAHVNFGVWLDSEASSTSCAFNKLSAAARTTCGLAFLEAMQAAGYQPGVYASDSWFGTHLTLSKLSAYPLWVAKYSTTPPKVVKSYAGWQYTSKGSVTGLSGSVDKSYFYTDLAAGKTTTATNATSGGFNVSTLSTIKSGSVGAQVTSLQLLLNGKDNAGLTVDGICGTKTAAAIKTYQQAKSLTVDGIAGVNTWTSLLTI